MREKGNENRRIHVSKTVMFTQSRLPTHGICTILIFTRNDEQRVYSLHSYYSPPFLECREIARQFNYEGHSLVYPLDSRTYSAICAC